MVYVPKEIENIHLDELRFSVQTELSKEFMREFSSEIYENDLRQSVRFKFETSVFGEKFPITEIKVPKTWKDAFKKYTIEEKLGKKFPKIVNWFLKKYPIEYDIIKFQPRIIYPQITSPDIRFIRQYDYISPNPRNPYHEINYEK